MRNFKLRKLRCVQYNLDMDDKERAATAQKDMTPLNDYLYDTITQPWLNIKNDTTHRCLNKNLATSCVPYHAHLPYIADSTKIHI